MVSRLPINPRPAAAEIAVSYLTRLAALNDMPFAQLWSQVSTRRDGASPRQDGGLLATVAAQPRSRLARALIELHDPAPDWLALRHEPQRGCRRCDARHPGGPVLHLLGHHRYLCTRHRIWIGPPDLIEHSQPDLHALPDVVAAQHRHLRLLRRLGPAATYDAVLTGFLFCAHRWNFTDTTDPDDACRTWTRRTDLLIPPGTETHTYSASRLFAATYPEAVAIAELIGSLHWRRLAAGGPPDQRRFTDEIARRLGLRGYHPTLIKDPIAHWIEQDCWQPPSLPHTDYRSLRTFAGPTFAKPATDSDTTRVSAAVWFDRKNRLGGDTLLHHRSLNPVVIRDWSMKLEQFTGALVLTTAVSAETLRGIDGPHSNIKYVRPEPAPSAFLDTAVEPLPWTQRNGPRPSRGARPARPDHQRRKSQLGFYPSNPLRSAN